MFLTPIYWLRKGFSGRSSCQYGTASATRADIRIFRELGYKITGVQQLAPTHRQYGCASYRCHPTLCQLTGVFEGSYRLNEDTALTGLPCHGGECHRVQSKCSSSCSAWYKISPSKIHINLHPSPVQVRLHATSTLQQALQPGDVLCTLV